MEIRKIKKSEWEKLQAFNAAEYKADHILTNKVYYDWQFDAPWNSDKETYETLGMFDSKGNLIGTFGLFSTPHNHRGTMILGTQLCNLIVKKELRALGYGYLLLDKASTVNKITIDHTINDSAWPMFEKSGWQKENLKRWIHIIKPDNDLYSLSASAIKPIMKNGWHFDQVSQFGEEMDEFWNRAKKRYPITLERTAEYLNWRFAKNPLVKYLMFVVKGEEKIRGLVVARSESVKNEKGPLGVKVLRIIDLIVDEDAEGFACSRIAECARENNFDFVEYFSSGAFHDQGLEAAGFENGNKGIFARLPILFNPVSFKRTHLNFAVKTKDKKDLSDWYTTKGGGDQDRA